MYIWNKLDGLIVRYLRSRFCRQRLLRGLYSDEFIYSLLRKSERRHVWVVAAPKSGSTWLTVTLQSLLRWPSNSMVPSYGRREQEIDIRGLVTSDSYDNLISIHQHCRCSAYTLEAIRRAGIKVIISSRNIFDTVYSLADHFCFESTEGAAAYLTDEQWGNMEQDARLRFIVKMIIPWYINFYAGWLSWMRESEAIDRVFLSSYEALKRDPVSQLRVIMEFIGVAGIQDVHIETALSDAAAKHTRKNVATLGRGRNLPKELAEEILQMTSFYPDIDFGVIGIRHGKRLLNGGADA